MPYARTGPSEFQWVPEGEPYFAYTGPIRTFPKPWENAPATPAAPPVAKATVNLGNADESGLLAAIQAIAALPNVTGSLRRLAREFGTVPMKNFIDTAEQAGVNRHTATKQARLGRQGVE